MGAEREDEVARVEEADRLQPRLEPFGQVVREVRHQRDVEERFAAIGRAFDEELSALVRHVLLVGLEQVRGDLLRLLLDLLGRHVDRRCADGTAAAAVAAHPERHLAGVAVDDVDVVDRNLQFVGDDLRERRLVALAVRMRAGEDRHLPGRMDADVRALVQARLRPERARHRRRREPTRLEVGGEADAEVPALFARRLLLTTERLVVEDLQGLVEGAGVVAAVVEQRDRRLVRELVGRDEVLAPDLDRIHPQLARRQVDEPLDHIRGFGPACAAVRVHRRGVREDARHLTVDGGRGVRAREQRSVQVRRHRRRE